jgi:hypothetical protein
MPAEPKGLLESRLLIFGLSRSTTVQDVRTLLGRCDQASVRIVVMPGDGDDVMGVVHLPPDWGLAHRLADQLNHRRLHGRNLQCWVPAMAWH